MKLIIQSYDYGRGGGIARYIDSFLETFPKDENIEITLLTADSEKAKTTIPKGWKLKYYGLPTNNGNYSRLDYLKWAINCMNYVKEQYKQNNVDFVIIHIPSLIPALFMYPKVRYIVTAHTTFLGDSGEFYAKRYFPSRHSKIILIIRKLLEKIIFKKAYKLITLTVQGKQELTRYGVSSNKISIIPNGVFLDEFVPKLTVKKHDVLFIGRLETRKGSRAIPIICKKLIALNKTIKIAIVGSGRDDKFVKEHLAEEINSNNVVIIGSVSSDKVMEYYNQSKVYASTSYYEGLPGTCIEAMAMNLPVVVWDFPFYDDLVINNKTGIRVQPNDYDAFSNEINNLINDSSRIKEFNQNSKPILNKYDWKIISKQIIDKLRE